MSLHGNDVCLLEVEDYNLYEEEASNHAFARSEKHSSGGRTMEAEKRIRREIANSNERRRMQSINAGFQALRTLLPRHEGEKLSKAAILQQTAEYIYSLEQEKTRLLSQNCQLKRLLNQHEGGEIPLKKRKSEMISHIAPTTIIPDSTDDSVAKARSPEPVAVISIGCTKKDPETAELRVQLERERRLRRLLEERLHAVYPSPAPAPEPQDCKLETEEVEAPVPAPVPAPTPPPPPPPPAAPLLEAAIKAEPRVEVEVLPVAPDAERLYHLASTSRQNLETIVEAIRHLEGDHMFGDAPLALTKKAPAVAPAGAPPRPGVIVVKHS
ncbi:LOW QUALITY PROTEIN: transcription factor AP-4 [Leguminivora glycinivorella]|uniref:LOW QUALITY PROTEIN: transcription factor AP-4 n=1 Tax=Leguminivora glycinivorella TaxID=1035111 RepID=UPI002010285B|nr:LOW QUALITY PROTEIN: transcription factor AP-4 [Leguminivora glycinivorella]